MKMFTYAACALTLAACSSTPEPQAPEAPPETAAEPAPVEPSAIPEKSADQGNIAISDRIKTACGISDANTFFSYNSASVSGNAKTVLQKLATCFATGPLAGTQMKLVGHADNRGDDEYNLALGGRRADGVKKVLAGLGLSADHISTTSRGEIDSTGTDEASWAKDRKVEVKVDD